MRVNVIAPGGVDTPLVGKFELPEGATSTSCGRMMSPWEFPIPVDMGPFGGVLASDESAYTTGAVLSVDGGLTI